ncbi:hypothetical protein SNOG_04130 [Parastagonospora nodorum SN15]|uniref:Uncharacterized protein n=1 Tax=Phaeosphaeria nodorum (strain SN15 / ATCC MYA-4574 / FGSC 10173) TaxID=321614 RepID=Q0UVT4_PHANO|nr:hypothetical protein SNOG_04130 [Parastagonospora nodorum SN15]EAT87890.1 hypothetical protein SNOG_04130 [Parastagonospora nodorum SN15]
MFVASDLFRSISELAIIALHSIFVENFDSPVQDRPSVRTLYCQKNYTLLREWSKGGNNSRTQPGKDAVRVGLATLQKLLIG